MKSLIKIAFQRCKECGYCIDFYPSGSIKGRKLNSNGYPPVITNIDKCLACGTCARSVLMPQYQFIDN